MILRFFNIYISMNKKWFRFVLFILIVSSSIIAASQVFREEKQPEPQSVQPRVTLYLSASDKKVAMTLEEYIVGTVAAEMPASFAMEALKAQAVCARTYAVNRLVGGKKYRRQADLSDDITCCQAFVNKDDFKKRHPSTPEYYLQRIKQAVKATEGEVMLYQGQPLDAMYCSTCGGRTEDASATGGQDVPYLKGVACGYCQASPRYTTSQSFSESYLKRIWGLSGKGLQIQVLSTTNSGRLRKVRLNDQVVSGEQLRSTLGLPSTWCSFTRQGDSLVISSRGYGHGIGLCQFGANGMAKAGYNYRQILHHYYHSFELHRLSY